MVKSHFELPAYQSKFRGNRQAYETLFAEGIRLAVQQAVEQAANVQVSDRRERWQPLEQARQWVMNHLPLLGALAAQMRVITDASLCDRMDISMAAVNGFLGEIVLSPGSRSHAPEVLFVYVHELLHVRLLHATRLQGRDHEVWNIACDFVINGWLVEMGVGRPPQIGLLYDPRLPTVFRRGLRPADRG